MGLLSMQHHPQQQQPQHQGHQPSQQLHHSRPSSIVHQQHQAQAHPPPAQQQHQPAYSPSPSLSQAYQTGGHTANAHDSIHYYNHPSPYSTPGATSGGYASADTTDMMAAAQMPRPPYPPMSYHTPQSNSPASVASPSQHDHQHRNIYGQPPSQHMPQSMYYQPQPPYHQSMAPQAASPYAQHAPHPQHSMGSQPNMMMSHAPQSQMAHHAQAMAGSPRPKMESQVPLQLHKQPQTSPMPQGAHHQNGGPLHSPGGTAPGVNPNAAPGPIPATTPLVVRQDGNGVQWIAFEYSRDRVKMEYTIRCDVESVNTDELGPDFKTENCVYPRACCAKDQYRGNRLAYETDCNRVGWALAQLNPPLRGKRGLIQRAVDSWRNSNQDPRLRSRRVRRMAKMTNRKVSHPSAAHMPGPGGPSGMHGGPGSMGPGAAGMGKPGLSSMGPAMHHNAGGHHADGQPGDEVGETSAYPDPPQHQDVRQAHVFHGYGGQGYPSADPSAPVSHMTPHAAGPAPARKRSRSHADEPDDLFPDIPEAKKRKFILVDDNVRGSRLRVRVTLEGVDTNEIPDSFRKGASLYPRTYFPREMQSPPPSAMGSQFFADDASDDGVQETEGRQIARGAGRFAAQAVKVPVGEGQDGEISIGKMGKTTRGREVRLNDLGYRMAWLQSRVFAGRTVFLQRAMDCYRNKTRAAIEGTMQDVQNVGPHYEARAGKRRWSERSKRSERRNDEDDD